MARQKTESQRITLVLKDETAKKIRLLQAKKIKETNKSCSFSSIVNDLLDDCL